MFVLRESRREATTGSHPWLVGGSSVWKACVSGTDDATRFIAVVPGRILLLAVSLLLILSCGGETKVSEDNGLRERETTVSTKRPDDCPAATVGGEHIYLTDLLRASKPKETGLDPSSSESAKKKVLQIRYTSHRWVQNYRVTNQEIDSLPPRP